MLKINSSPVSESLLTNIEKNDRLPKKSTEIIKALAAVRNSVDSRAAVESPSPPNNSCLTPKQFNVYMHSTASENLPSIYKNGLIAGGLKTSKYGMGDADNAQPCKEGVFVINPTQSIGTDARDGVVAVVSTTEPIPDPNYKPGTAGLFVTPKIPPLREAADLYDINQNRINSEEKNTEEGNFASTTPPGQIYSFVPEEITPKTMKGASAFHRLQGVDKSPKTATEALLGQLTGNYKGAHTAFLKVPNYFMDKTQSDTENKTAEAYDFSDNSDIEESTLKFSTEIEEGMWRLDSL